MALSFQPFAENQALQDLGERLYENVGTGERTLSYGLGLAALTAGVEMRGFGKLLFLGAGAALLYRGISGHCPVYDRMKHGPQ